MEIKGIKGFYYFENIDGYVFETYFDAKKWLDLNYNLKRAWQGLKKK